MVRLMAQTLFRQLEHIAVVLVNRPWWNHISPPEAVKHLSARAFIENWPRDIFASRVLLRYDWLLTSQGYISIDEPGIETSPDDTRQLAQTSE